MMRRAPYRPLALLAGAKLAMRWRRAEKLWPLLSRRQGDDARSRYWPFLCSSFLQRRMPHLCSARELGLDSLEPALSSFRRSVELARAKEAHGVRSSLGESFRTPSPPPPQHRPMTSGRSFSSKEQGRRNRCGRKRTAPPMLVALCPLARQFRRRLRVGGEGPASERLPVCRFWNSNRPGAQYSDPAIPASDGGDGPQGRERRAGPEEAQPGCRGQTTRRLGTVGSDDAQQTGDFSDAPTCIPCIPCPKRFTG